MTKETFKTQRRAKEFADEFSTLLAKKIKIGKIKFDDETETEYLPLIVEMKTVYYGFIKKFEEKVGLKFYGIEKTKSKIHLLFIRAGSSTI